MTNAKRLAAAIIALCALFLTCCSNKQEPVSPSPAPAQEVVGVPTPAPTLAPTPSPSPTPAPTALPDFYEGVAAGVLPEAGTPRYFKNGETFLCPHGSKGVCETCLLDGALPLPDAERLTEALRFFTAQSRLTGSEYCNLSADFIVSALKECGYEPVLQPVGTDNTGYVFSGESAVAFSETLIPMEYVYGGAQGVSTGPAILCGPGHPLPQNCNGAVLVDIGGGTLSVIKSLNLGTPAAVILVQTEPSVAESIPTLWPDAIVLATNDANFEKLVKNGDVLTVSSTNNGPFESANIIAEANPNGRETILLCAHYDSAATTPGANDNAAGAALLLELARVFAKVPSNYRIVFLFTTGEEQGLLGSWVYAKSMTEQERGSARAMFALDMFADRNQGLPFAYTCDGEPDEAYLSLLSACAAHGLPAPDLKQESRSDHAPFDGLGIPALLIAQGESDELYHTPYDTMDKLSAFYMDTVFCYMAAVLRN